MAGEWQKVRFEEAPFEIIDGDRGTNYPKQGDFLTHGYCLFLNTGNVTKKGFDFSSCAFITQSKDDTLRKGKLKEQDIVLTTRGTVGNVAFYDSSVPFENIRINSGMVIIRPNSQKITPRYLYIFLRSAVFHEQISFLSSGSAQPQLPIRDMKRIEIPLPPLPVQQRIADVLGALDDKIEVNRRINRALEQMAQALFRHWFVDFGPFQGGEFVESELGLIPAGWEAAPFGNYIEVTKGLSYKGSGLSKDSEDIPMHNLNSVHEGGGYKYEGIKYYKGEYKERHIIFPGDVIVANTEQTFDYLLIGCPAIVPKRYKPFGIFTHHLFRVRPLSGAPISSNFIYLCLRNATFRGSVVGHANGTTVNMLPAEGLTRTLVITPSSEAMQRFDQIIEPVLAHIEANHDESRKLAATRDYLLPRLLSGEVTVPEGEALLAT